MKKEGSEALESESSESESEDNEEEQKSSGITVDNQDVGIPAAAAEASKAAEAAVAAVASLPSNTTVKNASSTLDDKIKLLEEKA